MKHIATDENKNAWASHAESHDPGPVLHEEARPESAPAWSAEPQPSRRPDALQRVAAPDARSPSVSVVIPTLDEAYNLPHVLPRIPGWVHEVLLVDGHSRDNTIEVARALRPDIRVLEQTGRGKGNALRAGFAAAQGDIIVMLDADGSTDPREIPAFVGALLAGADFAKGSRFLQGGGTADMDPMRHLGHEGLLTLFKLLFPCNYSDLCYGYNAFWRRVLPQLDLDADGFEIETLMNVRVLQAKLHVAEVHSFEAPRVNGKSHLQTFPDGWRVLRTMLRERFGNRRKPAAAAPRKQSPADTAPIKRVKRASAQE